MKKVGVLFVMFIGFFLFSGAESVTNNLDVQGGFIYNHGVVNPDDVGLTFTNAGIRDITISAGQLSGVDPETGLVITNSANLLSLKAESLETTGNITAGGSFIGDGSGLTNLNVNFLSGPIPASSLPTFGTWNASGVTITNLAVQGELDMDGYKITNLGTAVSDTEAASQGRVKTLMQQVPEYGDLSMGKFTSQIGLPERPIPTVIQTEDLAGEAVTLGKIQKIAPGSVMGNLGGAVAVPSEVSVLDEDNMASDSDSALATQQSIKAYVDTTSAAQAQNYAMKYSGVTVYSGSMPTSFTDLDLSGTIGTNRCFVHLSVTPDTLSSVIFRPNGETKNIAYDDSRPAGTTFSRISSGNIAYFSVITDESGVVEWDSNAEGYGGTVVKVLTYQVLQ